MTDKEKLASEIISTLKKRGLTLATAESCTGGMLTSAIIDIAGASDVFLEGCVVYTNEAKIRTLSVSPETLRVFGAVSEQTAKEMAAGACLYARADASIATTGIAGPTGGTKQKPVGLVYIAAALGGRLEVKELRLSGSRTQIREQASYEALALLNDILKGSEK